MSNKIRLASRKYCTGCMACYDACKQNAINIYEIEKNPYVKIDTNKCIECKQCEKACPIINPIQKNDSSELQAYGGWATDDKIRIAGASGGIFGAIADNFFSTFEHAVVVGATLENNRVYHTVISSKDEIWKLQNSKYVQSNTEGIHREIKEYINQGYYVLFSGMPCQVAGLYGYLRALMNVEKLYTIDLICHGITSIEALNIHLQINKADEIVSFREKYTNTGYPYVTRLNVKGDKYKKEDKNVFYKIYTSGLINRKSCSNCQYSALPRIADITIGDFWGGKIEREEFKKGVSLILTNNSHGEKLINQAQKSLYCFNTPIRSVFRANCNIYSGYKFIQYHPMVLFPRFMKRCLPHSLRLAILTNKMPWRLLWAMYKIPTILWNKYQYKKLKRYINEKDRNYNHI